MLKELKKRNFKVDLPILVRDYVKEQTGIDVIHTLTDVKRINVRLIRPVEYLLYPTAVYDITGVYTGLKYLLRFYARHGVTPLIGSKVIDGEEKPLLPKLRYGFTIMMPEHDLIPYRNYGRFPIIYDDIITREDWCLASSLPILDQYGNNYCEEIINTDPVITLLGDESYTLAPGELWVEPGAIATDAEDGDITNQITIHGYIPIVNGYHPPGLYTFTYSVIDALGATTTVLRTIEVLPNELPTITLNASTDGIVSPIVLIQGNSYIDPGYTASDVEDGDLTSSVVVNTGGLDLDVPSIYTISYSVTDALGATTTVTRLVQVIEDESPIISLTGDSYGNISPIAISITHTTTLEEYQAMIPGATAVDNEDGDITANIIVVKPNELVSGTYTAAYSVVDSYGHTVTINRTINLVVEDEYPVITLLPDADGNVSPVWISIMSTTTLEEYQAMIPGATAVDTEDGDITDDIRTTFPSYLTGGSYGAIYSVTDSFGHSVSVSRNIYLTVIEDEYPVITLLPDTDGNVSPIDITIPGLATVEEYQALIPGATAMDNEDGDLTSNIITTLPSTLDTGSYAASYSVTDSANHTTTINRIINLTVLPDEVPVITLLPDANGNTTPITVYARADVTLEEFISKIEGATAFDTEDGDITSDIIINYPTEATSGTHTTTYTVTDSYGNTASIERIINLIVLPDEYPVITLLPDADFAVSPIAITIVNTTTVEMYQAMIPGATASDSEDGDITSSIVTTLPDTLATGIYTATYTVTDSAGNTTTVDRIINLTLANTMPTIDLLPDADGFRSVITVKVPSDATVETIISKIPGATAWDAEDGDLTDDIVVADLPTVNVEGVVRVSYTVGDSGNIVTTTYREVNIVWAPDIIIGLNYTTPLTIDETATNEWDTVYKDDYVVTYVDDLWEVVITGDAVDTTTAGEYTVVYTVTDTTYGATDSVTAVFTVMAAGSSPPYIDLVGAIDQLYVATSPAMDYNYVEYGYTATDPQLGDVTADVVITDENQVYGPTGMTLDKVYTITTAYGTGTAVRHITVLDEPN